MVITPEVLSRATAIIEKAEKALGYSLTDGQKRDLLMDNTGWGSSEIRQIVEFMKG